MFPACIVGFLQDFIFAQNFDHFDDRAYSLIFEPIFSLK
jgi:hypothetical protein